MRALGQEQLAIWLARHQGKHIQVLMEENQKGHSDDFSVVHFSHVPPASCLVQAKVISTHDTHVLAQVVS